MKVNNPNISKEQVEELICKFQDLNDFSYIDFLDKYDKYYDRDSSVIVPKMNQAELNQYYHEIKKLISR